METCHPVDWPSTGTGAKAAVTLPCSLLLCWLTEPAVGEEDGNCCHLGVGKALGEAELREALQRRGASSGQARQSLRHITPCFSPITMNACSVVMLRYSVAVSPWVRISSVHLFSQSLVPSCFPHNRAEGLSCRILWNCRFRSLKQGQSLLQCHKIMVF